MDIQVVPAADVDGTPLGVTVTFTDVTQAHRLQAELQRSNQELETAYEELQSTNEELQTTNEELQSTVEELETTNEELQCTNEELETMNEELQSTNEELRTSNDQLHRRGDELNLANSLLESVLASVPSGVVGVDLDLRVILWNEGAEELWGLRREEAKGRPFMTLDIGLPLGSVLTAIRPVLEGKAASHEMVVSATNRRGRPIECRVRCTPLRAMNESPDGAVLLVEERQALPANDDATPR
jgi:two-component system CheB/CheR fusion protein